MKKHPRDCPLCKAESVYYRVDSGNLRYYKCPNCTYFQLSDRAEKNLLEAPQKWRDNFSEKAIKTPDQYLLVITIPSSPEEVDGSKIVITGNYEPKKSLSL